MTTQDMVLGPMADRSKTDLRLPTSLLERVREVAGILGVPMNAFFAMAAAMLLAQMSAYYPRRKRAVVLAELEELVQKVLEAAKERA